MALIDIKQLHGASQGSVLFLGTNSIVSENYNNLRWNQSTNTLVVDGGFQYIDGNQQSGYVLVSDANGNATWTSSIITGVTAGNGLSGGGTSGFITLDVQVDVTGLTVSGDTVRLQNTITGDRTFQDSVTVGGNLTVNGTVSYINTENLFIEDNVITLNATFSGTPFLNAGLEVNRGNETNASLIWNESTDLWSAGLSGSEVSILLNAGTGLSKNGSTVSLDFNSITGTGLTQNGSVISIDTSGFATALAGDGLSATGATLSVNTTNGIQIISDAVGLGGTLSQNTTINGDLYDLTIGNVDIIHFTSSVFDVESDFIILDSGTGSIQLIADDDIDIISTNGQLNISVDSGNVTTANLEGLVYTSDYTATFVTNSLITKGYVDTGTNSLWNAINSLGEGMTPSNGLSEISSGIVGLGGTLSQNTFINSDGYSLTVGNIDILHFTSSMFDVESNFVTIDAGTGSMQLIADDDVDIFSIGNQLSIGGQSGKVTIGNLQGLVYTADYTATFVTHSLITKGWVVNYLNKTPYYQYFNVSSNTSGDYSTTGQSILYTPDDLDTVLVFVNGQLQNLGDGVKTGVDCYFSNDGGTTPLSIVNISSGDTLYWNGVFSNFDLEVDDEICLVYKF